MTFHPLLEALGWALIQFLWQGTALTLAFLAFRSLARSASMRYAGGCIVMLAMAMTFAATIFQHLPKSAATESNTIPPAILGQSIKSHESAPFATMPALGSPASTAPYWIACAWIFGVLTLSLQTALGLARVRRLKRSGRQLLLASCLDVIRSRLGITRAVELYTSTVAQVPTVVGWIRPVILLPVTALTGLSGSQLEAILAHELAHIHRHDYLVNLIQTAIETLLFYHPGVWWVSRQIRQEREHCCDDIAVSVCGNPVDYASALAEMEELRSRIPQSAPPEPALAAAGGDLLTRVRRILGEPNPSPRPIGAMVALALLLVVPAAIALRAEPQDVKSARFEVASVKQLDQSLRPGETDLTFVGTAGKPFKIAGARVSIGGTLHKLIADAYTVKDYQISSLPSWADSLRFDITAVSPGTEPPTQDQARTMLQSLLSDRFQLKFHRDSKEMSVYHLVQAKSSKVFKPASDDEVFSWKVTQEPGNLIRSKATKESIGDFVQLVGVSTDRPVIDKTGITGFIDYDILIEPPAAARPGVEGQGGKSNADDLNRAIVNAVIDQLGLKLESAKDKVDVLVVDSVDKPSAN